MPLKLDIKRRLTARSDRVKCVDLHPTEPWMLASLYNGKAHIWNIDSQQLIKTFDVCEMPVRAAKFVARKNWIITASDDMQIRIFNYNTLAREHNFEGHSDYIRCIAVHTTQSFILTGSDDTTIRLWDWNNKWTCTQVFEGHSNYVMQIVINPKDNNTFASASLDKTIKIWNLGSGVANFTLSGHENGVNCIDYYSGADKPYLVSGADDRLVKIWDYQTKSCVQTLDGHAQNISSVAFHPELPIVVSGSEDGTVRVWHANTYRLENTLNYGLERVWTLACMKHSNTLAIGYDEGSIVIKLGREEPAMSMDRNGKMIFARHAVLQQANIKTLGNDMEDVQDGSRVPLIPKELGSCEIYPQTIVHNANGKFVVVCGDGEYVVYTAMALRIKGFGQAHEFVWSSGDPNIYAIRDNSGLIKIFKNFKDEKSFKPDFGTEMIFGGYMLAVRSVTGLSFYDWDTCSLVRRIEVSPNAVYWNESNLLVSVVTDESFYILRYDPNADPLKSDEEGIEKAFELSGNGEIMDVVKNGTWVGDCFLYTNSANRLQYCIDDEIIVVAHLEKQMHLLGYLAKENRVFLGDKELQITSYTLLLSVLHYQSLIVRGDMNSADRILFTIPNDQLSRIALFLEKKGFLEKALSVTTDMEHKFELALSLNEIDLAFNIMDVDSENCTEQKWKQISDAAIKACKFELAQECMTRANDYGGLLLLASSTGNRPMMERLSKTASDKDQQNIGFLSRFHLHDLDGCLQLLVDAGRLSEAGFFARAYLPSKIQEVVELWKKSLTTNTNKKIAEAIADPEEYSNLFPAFEEMKEVEKYLRTMALDNETLSASLYPQQKHTWERNVSEEMRNHSGGSAVRETRESSLRSVEDEMENYFSDDYELEKDVSNELTHDNTY